jgi:hypothetical protein
MGWLRESDMIGLPSLNLPGVVESVLDGRSFA